MKYFFLILITILSYKALATSYTPVTVIEGYTLGSGSVVRIKLKDRGDLEPTELCGESSSSDHVFYGLDMTSSNSEAQFSVILAAAASKSKIFFQLQGCVDGNRPKINHIYICDTMWCK